MNMWPTDAADDGCGGRLDFAPMRAISHIGQCDINIPSLSPCRIWYGIVLFPRVSCLMR